MDLEAVGGCWHEISRKQRPCRESPLLEHRHIHLRSRIYHSLRLVCTAHSDKEIRELWATPGWNDRQLLKSCERIFNKNKSRASETRPSSSCFCCCWCRGPTSDTAQMSDAGRELLLVWCNPLGRSDFPPFSATSSCKSRQPIATCQTTSARSRSFLKLGKKALALSSRVEKTIKMSPAPEISALEAIAGGRPTIWDRECSRGRSSHLPEEAAVLTPTVRAYPEYLSAYSTSWTIPLMWGPTLLSLSPPHRGLDQQLVQGRGV